MQLDIPALQRSAGQLGPSGIPALLRGLVRAPARRAADAVATDAPALREKLASMPVNQQQDLLLDLVRENAAVVLGQQSRDAVEADRAFKDLGFDSLTAVELRNRLTTATGLRLSATVIFDHPTPSALAQHIRAEFLPDSNGHTSEDPEEAEIRKVLASIPISALQEAGLFDALLKLANGNAEALDLGGNGEAGSIDAMDVASLVKMALPDQ
jgi:acyl carrier protein